MATQAAKVTISLPQHLIDLTDKIAKEKHISRSKMISSWLEELASKRFQVEMEEGYKAMAGENLQFAKTAITLAHEVLPEWKQ